MEQQKPIVRRLASSLDFKTLLIVILGAFIVLTLMFKMGNSGTAGMSKDELKRITERYEARIELLEAENQQFSESIADYEKENLKLLQSIEDKKQEVEDMKKLADARKRKIDELKKEKEKNIEKFKNMKDDELLEWFDEYFESKKK